MWYELVHGCQCWMRRLVWMLANVVVVQVDVGAWSPARYPGKAARGNLPDMPFKFNAAHRHRIPKPRYRVRNWSEYEAGLKRRGNLMLWVDEAAILGWQAPRRTTPGGQARYSDLAIQLVLTLRLVFHLALRQTEGLLPAVSSGCLGSICAFRTTPP